jgi:hypothetical protein
LNSNLQTATIMGSYGVMSVTPDCTCGPVGIDPTANIALCSRITMLGNLANAATVNATVNGVPNVPAICFMAYIPLRLLHDLFDKLDFPLPNCPLRISFYPSGMGSLTGYQPFTLPVQSPNFTLQNSATYSTGTAAIASTGIVTGTGTTFTAGMVGGVLTVTAVGANQGEQFLITVYTSATQVTVMPAPAANIVAGTYSISYTAGVADLAPTTVPNIPQVSIQQFADKWGYNGVCALKIKNVYFDGHDKNKLAAMYEKHVKKVIQFVASDLPPARLNQSTGATFNANGTPATAAPSGGSANINWDITTCVKPWRVTMMAMPAGTLASPFNTFPGTIGAFQPNVTVPASTAGTFYLRNSQIKIDGNNHFTNTIDGQREHYRLLEEQMNGAGTSNSDGSQISFADYLSGLNPYPFDIHRNPRLANNASVRLSYSGYVGWVGQPAANFDLYALVETIKTVKFSMADNKVSIMLDDGAHS